MAEGSSVTRRHASWHCLPLELRAMIFKEIACAREEHPGWCAYAAVSREWQHHIEAATFRMLRLDEQHMNTLRTTIQRRPERQKLVRHIWLDIELPTYTCRCCDRDESSWSIVKNRGSVADAITALFKVLAEWDEQKDLTLEINAYSPSDSNHYFGEWLYRSGIDDTEEELSRQAQQAHDRMVDSKTHRAANPQTRYLPPASVQRAFRSVSPFFRAKLPQVVAITGVIIRRQFRRFLCTESLQQILKRLPRLEHVTYEPWRPVDMHSPQVDWEKFATLAFPKSVEKVTVFQDFNDKLQNHGRPFNPPIVVRPPISPGIGKEFAIRSMCLKEISLSYMVNAEDFFQAGCKFRTLLWPNLESLALTSKCLTQEGSHKDIDSLLYNAGVAALRMPRLHTLVLWNGNERNACAFIYRKTGMSTDITWRSTWGFKLNPLVVEAWEEVAFKLHVSTLRINKDSIKKDEIRNHGDASK
ncbi:hypothetical protein F4810DRAFT_684960 [Camillea tinctor]|nr:hypothetical protein F4810DRAFT_684960 [Camillea tinctor]